VTYSRAGKHRDPTDRLTFMVFGDSAGSLRGGKNAISPSAESLI